MEFSGGRHSSPKTAPASGWGRSFWRGELQGGLPGTLVAGKVQYGLQALPGKGPGKLLLRAAHCCPSACVSDTQAPRTDGFFKSGYARLEAQQLRGEV